MGVGEDGEMQLGGACHPADTGSFAALRSCLLLGNCLANEPACGGGGGSVDSGGDGGEVMVGGMGGGDGIVVLTESIELS